MIGKLATEYILELYGLVKLHQSFTRNTYNTWKDMKDQPKLNPPDTELEPNLPKNS